MRLEQSQLMHACMHAFTFLLLHLDAIITLLTYEAIQEKWIMRSQLQHQGMKDMASGAIAGGVGSFLTNPMDVGTLLLLLLHRSTQCDLLALSTLMSS